MQSEHSESEQSKQSVQARKRWLGRIPKELGILLIFAALLVLGYYGRSLTRQIGSPDRCWELQEVDGQLYKSNPCTGQFLLLGDAPSHN